MMDYLKVEDAYAGGRRGSGTFPPIKRILAGLRLHKSSEELHKIRGGHKSRNDGGRGSSHVSRADQDGQRAVVVPARRGASASPAPSRRRTPFPVVFLTPQRTHDSASSRQGEPADTALSTPSSNNRPNMKKSLTEPKAAPHKRRKSPVSFNRNQKQGDGSSSSGGAISVARLRNPNTTDASLLSDGGQSHDESEPVDSSISLGPAIATNGGSASDATVDDLDGVTDQEKKRVALEHVQRKIRKTMDLIKTEQNAKEENVNEYLRLSASADKIQSQRIKTVFEKKNQISTKNIAQLQKKLEHYQQKQQDIEHYGVTGHKQAREVLKDMGQGLKGIFSRDTATSSRSRDPSPTGARDVGANIRDGLTGFSGGVVDNIRGAKDTIVSKPKEFAHLLKNKLENTDVNNTTIKGVEESQGSTDDGEKHSHHSGTHSAGLAGASRYPYAHSDDEASSVTSESASAPNSSPHATLPTSIKMLEEPQLEKVVEPIVLELRRQQDNYQQISYAVESFKSEMEKGFQSLKQAHEEERYRSEHMEEQINDLTELHQHEVTNIKQELASMEEKMEYQLEERTRDMQDLLETCQTRITKMELQQQQQQLISMEGIENSNFRALITKLINVVLALLAVVLVLVSTIANLLGPFLTTRLRILSTVCLIACIVAVWQNWTFVRGYSESLMDQYGHILPFR